MAHNVHEVLKVHFVWYNASWSRLVQDPVVNRIILLDLFHNQRLTSLIINLFKLFSSQLLFFVALTDQLKWCSEVCKSPSLDLVKPLWQPVI